MSVYRRRSGKYAVLVDLERGADGERRRHSLGTFATRKQAERAEREALSARDRGIDLVPGTVTVADVFARFLDDAKPRLAPKTIERYEEIGRLHVIPRVGSLAIAKLRPAHVAELYSDLATKGTNGRRLSPRTVHHVHRVLHRIVAWAERMELVERNVVRAVDPPKVASSEAKALTADEVATVLEISESSRWNPLFILAFATGARRGELLALKWPDVDLDAETLTIRRALSQTRAGVAVKATKTDRLRIVRLSRMGLDALHRIRASQAAEKLKAGEAYRDHEFVFADELGGMLPPHAASDAFRDYARKARISTTRLHAARHTAATLMLGGGADVRTVAGVLGHSAASTTLNVYGHLIAGRAVVAVDALGDELERARARARRTRV